MLKVTNTDKHEAKATSAQQGKENKAKQQAKTLPDTEMSIYHHIMMIYHMLN
ncbi:hypothetical protein HBP66_10315, partial [Staphylococcus aureus]|nr:hypothetical protein [Staphylococcus aureus]